VYTADKLVEELASVFNLKVFAILA
jgi:hypothetical protein